MSVKEFFYFDVELFFEKRYRNAILKKNNGGLFMRTLKNMMYGFVAFMMMAFCFEEKIEAFSELPVMGVTSLGTLVATWESFNNSGDTYIYAATKTSAGNWSTPVLISQPTSGTSGQRNTNPVIGIDPGNNTYVVWSSIDSTTSNNVLWGSALLNGQSTWTTPHQITLSTDNVVEGYIIKANNNVGAAKIALIWNAYTNSSANLDIFASIGTSGNWSTPVDISSGL